MVIYVLVTLYVAKVHIILIEATIGFVKLMCNIAQTFAVLV